MHIGKCECDLYSFFLFRSTTVRQCSPFSCAVVPLTAVGLADAACVLLLRMDQLAINMLGIAPAVFPACIVRNCETSTTLPILDLFDDVRIEAVARLHLAEHNVV